MDVIFQNGFINIFYPVKLVFICSICFLVNPQILRNPSAFPYLHDNNNNNNNNNNYNNQ